jgi:hypothetical protein
MVEKEIDQWREREREKYLLCFEGKKGLRKREYIVSEIHQERSEVR